MSDNLKEREAFEAFLLGNYGKVYSKEDVDRFIEHGHVSWLTWKARAALAQAQSLPDWKATDQLVTFDTWMRSVCLQAPPDHAQDLARSAWYASDKQASADCEVMAEEIERLQKALAFWMPGVPIEEHPLHERVAHDAYLLAGYDGPNNKPSAFELGLVALAASPAQPVQPSECWCESCDLAQGSPMGRTRMSVCPQCGDKRCPRAKHHDSACQVAQPVQPSDPWLPIETAPKDGTEIIMSNGKDVSAGSWFNGSDGTCDRDGAPNCDEQDAGWMDWSGGMLPEPTNWMPLPPAPQPKD